MCLADAVLNRAPGSSGRSSYRDLLSFNGFGGTVAANLAVTGFGVVSGVVLARTLGPDGRGDLAAAIQWASSALALADMGLGFAIAHRAGTDPEDRGSLWWLALVVAAGWGGVVALVATPFLPHLVHPSAASALRVALWVIPFALALGFQSYLLLGSGRVMAHNAARLTAAFAYTCGIVLLAVFGVRNVAVFAIVFVTSQSLGAAVAFGLLKRTLRLKRMLNLLVARSLGRFGLKTQAASIAASASLRLDQLLLSVLVPARDLGLYVVAVAAAGLVGPLYTAAAVIVIPRLNQIQDRQLAIRVIVRNLAMTMLVCTPLVGIAFVAMPLILRVLFGPAYAGSLQTARILVVASLFQGMNAILGNSMRATGRPGAPAIAESVGMGMTVALLIILLPRAGITGAAIASLIAYAITTAVHAALLFRGTPGLPEPVVPLLESGPYR